MVNLLTIELNVDDNYFRSWYTPHINQEGEIIGLMGLSVNITERVHVGISFARERGKIPHSWLSRPMMASSFFKMG